MAAETGSQARRIVEITQDTEANRRWLLAAEALHREFRPFIPAGYADYMRRMFAEGAEMAVLLEGDAVCGIAVYRCYHTTLSGLRLYLDDLVTLEAKRSHGLGGELLEWCEAKARARGCAWFALGSGLTNSRGHTFYYRHGLPISSFGFSKKLAG
jgi:GNAT superfamily N-acetyltransferase